MVMVKSHTSALSILTAAFLEKIAKDFSGRTASTTAASASRPKPCCGEGAYGAIGLQTSLVVIGHEEHPLDNALQNPVVGPQGSGGVGGLPGAVLSWGFWQLAVVTQTTTAGWTCSGLGMWRSTRGLSGMPHARAVGKPLALVRGLSGVPLAVSGGRTEGRPAAVSHSFSRRRGPGGVGSVDLAATSGLRPRLL